MLKLLCPIIQSLERAGHSFGIKFWLLRLILRLDESLFSGLLGFKHFGSLVNLLIQLSGSNTSEHGLILLKPFDFIEFVSLVFDLQTRLSLIIEHKSFVIRHVLVRPMNTKDFSQKFRRLQSLIHLFQKLNAFRTYYLALSSIGVNTLKLLQFNVFAKIPDFISFAVLYDNFVDISLKNLGRQVIKIFSRIKRVFVEVRARLHYDSLIHEHAVNRKLVSRYLIAF